MKKAIVGPKSRLIGAKCRVCPNQIRTGESVLFTILRDVGYTEARFVIHTLCAAALVSEAPLGRAPGNPKAKLAGIRRQLRDGADLFELV